MRRKIRRVVRRRSQSKFEGEEGGQAGGREEEDRGGVKKHIFLSTFFR